MDLSQVRDRENWRDQVNMAMNIGKTMKVGMNLLIIWTARSFSRWTLVYPVSQTDIPFALCCDQGTKGSSSNDLSYLPSSTLNSAAWNRSCPFGCAQTAEGVVRRCSMTPGSQNKLLCSVLNEIYCSSIFINQNCILNVSIQINHQLDATVSPVYYPDVYLQLNMFRASSNPSSGTQQL